MALTGRGKLRKVSATVQGLFGLSAQPRENVKSGEADTHMKRQMNLGGGAGSAVAAKKRKREAGLLEGLAQFLGMEDSEEEEEQEPHSL